MKEIIEKRRTHCKVFDLGGRKRKVRVSCAPLHYVRDGKLVDIDTTPRLAGKLLEVTEAPYRLKIDPERPAYLYTNETGRQVEVELIEVGGQPVKARGSAQEAGTVRWKGIAPATDVAFRPLRKGIEALVVLYGPEAPRTWKWRVKGDRDLLLPPKGHDAKGQTLELTHSYDGDVLTIEWTGRATTPMRLRQKAGATEEIAWPVAVDPTINESIVDGVDDGHSVGGAQDLTSPYIFAGTYGGAFFDAGFRFRGVSVPPNATILSAVLTLDLVFVFFSPVLHLAGDAVDDAPQWSTSSRITNISQTTAKVQNITPGSTGLYPIGVTGIIQELVNRAGWASGNNMRFGLFSSGNFDGSVVAAALEHATRTEAQLEIEYEEAGGAAVAPKMMHYRRLRI